MVGLEIETTYKKKMNDGSLGVTANPNQISRRRIFAAVVIKRLTALTSKICLKTENISVDRISSSSFDFGYNSV